MKGRLTDVGGGHRIPWNPSPAPPPPPGPFSLCFSPPPLHVPYLHITWRVLRCRNLQKLESLEVCGGQVTDVGAAVISLIPSLTSLSLAHNVGITDAALGHLSRLTHLCSLNLTHSKITGSGVTALYGLTVGLSETLHVACRSTVVVLVYCGCASFICRSELMLRPL